MFDDYWWMFFFLFFLIPLHIQYQKKAKARNQQGRCGGCDALVNQTEQIQLREKPAVIAYCLPCAERLKRQMKHKLIIVAVMLLISFGVTLYFFQLVKPAVR